jgi:uracil-DNA glycosylase family 4
VSGVSTGIAQGAEIECDRCPLALTRSHVVIGRGSRDAEVMFVGEAPGRQEDRSGLGFQGAAGRRFEEILSFVGLGRDEIWLANAVRCRPSVDGRRNRTPSHDEIQACRDWLTADIRWVAPKLVVTLGRVAFETVTGCAWQAEQRLQPVFVAEFNLIACALYHPAYLIYRRDFAPTYRQDLVRLRSVLADCDVAIHAPTGPWAEHNESQGD